MFKKFKKYRKIISMVCTLVMLPISIIVLTVDIRLILIGKFSHSINNSVWSIMSYIVNIFTAILGLGFGIKEIKNIKNNSLKENYPNLVAALSYLLWYFFVWLRPLIGSMFGSVLLILTYGFRIWRYCINLHKKGMDCHNRI